MNRYDDDHFKHWPFPVTEEEVRADGYLRSLTPTEELALFLSLRGHCLREAGRVPEAVASYAQAFRLAPASRPYRLLLAEAQRSLALPAGTNVASFSLRNRHPYARAALLPPSPSTRASSPAGPPDPNPRLKLRQP